VTLFGYAPQVLPAVDPDFGEVLERQLETKGVSAGMRGPRFLIQSLPE